MVYGIDQIQTEDGRFIRYTFREKLSRTDKNT